LSPDTRSLTTESDEGTGGRVPGSDPTSAGHPCLQSQAPGRQWQADPASRAARGPSTGSGAAAEPFQHTRTATKSNEARVGTRGPRLARDAPAATCLRRKKARLPGIICRRLEITADLRGDLGVSVLAVCHAVTDILRGHGHVLPGHCLPLGALLVELFQRHGHGRRPALAVLHGSAQPLRRPGAVVGFGDDRGIGPVRGELIDSLMVAAVADAVLVFWPGCCGEYRFPGDPPAGLVVDDVVGDLVAAHLLVVHAHRERIPSSGDN
jgi:hypothetical protein